METPNKTNIIAACFMILFIVSLKPSKFFGWSATNENRRKKYWLKNCNSGLQAEDFIDFLA